MYFERLPPEMLTHVLEAVSSLRDLHRLISASPACYRLFALKPDLYLQAVLRNIVPGESLRLLAAIGSVPEFRHGDEEAVHAEQLAAFFDQYFGPGAFPFPRTKSSLVSLCHLHARVVRFANIYMAKAVFHFEIFDWSVHQIPIDRLRLYEDDTHEDDPFPSLRGPLTGHELARLQRAFLLFELCCRAFPFDSGNSYSNEEQYELFLSRVPPWKIEEISCVYHCLSSAIQLAIDKVEQQVESAVSATSDRASMTTARTAAQNPPGHIGDANDPQDPASFDNRNLDWLARFQSEAGPQYAAVMTSLGLQSISDFFRSDIEDKKELILAHPPVPRPFVVKELDFKDIDFAVPEPWQGDDPAHPALGQHMFGPSGRGLGPDGRPDIVANNLLRELAWVFWDSWRITPAEISKRLGETR